MKKRVLALLLAAVMIAGFAVGCGKAPAETNDAPAGPSDTPANTNGDALEGTLNIFQFKVEINDALIEATELQVRVIGISGAFSILQ